jgi:hypothetical protein
MEHYSVHMKISTRYCVFNYSRMLDKCVFIKYDLNPGNHTGYYYVSSTLMFKNICFFPIQCIYSFHVILTIISKYFPKE